MRINTFDFLLAQDQDIVEIKCLVIIGDWDWYWCLRWNGRKFRGEYGGRNRRVGGLTIVNIVFKIVLLKLILHKKICKFL